jgi:hypothetical protein
MLEQFLAAVVPPNGWIYVGHPGVHGDGEPTFFHAAFQAPADAARWLLLQDGLQRDTYFALASYKDAKPDGRRYRRRLDNVAFLGSFFVDIDTGKPGAYPDKATAAQDTFRAVAALGLPSPSFVVDSGGGLHVYWLLDAPAPLDAWKPVADALKRGALAQAWRIDGAVTGDAARVLRPVGTRNHKRGGLPVRLIGGKGQRYPLAAFQQALLRFAPVTAATANEGLNAELSAGRTVEWHTQPILEECVVLQHVAKTAGADCDEPLWKDTLSLLAFTKDGSAFVHPLSSGHPGYTAEATDLKFAQRMEVKDRGSSGPPTCSAFELHRPSLCAQCPHRGHVKSPIVLGLPRQRVPVPPAQAAFATQQSIRLPFGFRLNNGALEHRVVDKKGNEEWRRVMPYLVDSIHLHDVDMPKLRDRSVQIGESMPTQVAAVRLRYLRAIYQVTLTLSDFADTRAFVKAVGAYGVMLTAEQADVFRRFVMGYLQELQGAAATPHLTRLLGWVDGAGKTGFAYGQHVYWQDGSSSTRLTDDAEFGASYAPRGSFEEWRKLAWSIVDRGRPELSVILATAFAAPLVRFTGVPSVVVSVIAPTGQGKSTAIRAAQAVWGSPKFGVLNFNDTANAVQHRIGKLRHLPAYWDEIQLASHPFRRQEFTDLLFTFMQGREKARLTAQITAREAQTWETMLLCAANDSLVSQLADNNAYVEPIAARILEIEVDDRPGAGVLPPDIANAAFTNYGHAGAVYAQWLAANERTAQDVVRHYTTEVEKAFGRTGGLERFWHASIVTLLSGAYLAAQLKLAPLDAGQMAHFLAQSRVAAARAVSTIREDASDPANMIAEFLAEKAEHVLWTSDFAKGPGRHVIDVLQPEPRSRFVVAHVVRYPDRTEARVSKTALKKWCRDHRQSYNHLARALATSGKLIEDGRAVLGAGTIYSSAARIPFFHIVYKETTP